MLIITDFSNLEKLWTLFLVFRYFRIADAEKRQERYQIVTRFAFKVVMGTTIRGADNYYSRQIGWNSTFFHGNGDQCARSRRRT